MFSPLAKRLRKMLMSRFVGRNCEQELFSNALKASELPFSVLQIFGPGGVGKTTLIRKLAYLCEEAQIPVIYLDARQIEPEPESFLNALRSAINLKQTDSPIEILASGSCRQVLLLDTYERLALLDDWLRQVFLPQLSEQTLIVLAGRYPPSVAWRTDPGWQSLLYPLSLRNLSPSESRLYLTQQKVPPCQQQTVLDFTHGHPLALSLIADLFAQKPDIHFQAEVNPDIIKTLLEKFLEEVPSRTHQMALEACAVARLMSESLLSKMLDLPDVSELFEWLRRLSFIESERQGLFPHDLAREALVADLRWRHPDWYAELHQRARAYYTTHLDQTQGQEHHRVLFDYIFLHRDNRAVKFHFIWKESSSLQCSPLSETERPAAIAMVSTHEGEASACLASFWLDRQPQDALIFRDTEQQIAGFLLKIALHQASPDALNADPATRAAWHYLQNSAPLRPGEGATIFRFWMARDTYQGVSSVQSLIFLQFVQHHRNTPGLAFTFLPCAEPDFWAAMFAYADLARISDADFEVGGRRYGVYGHDWRILPPKEWQELLACREIDASAQAVMSSTVSDPLLVLSQSEFFEAVRHALRHVASPNVLLSSPLLRSRLVIEQVTHKTGQRERVTALQTSIKAAVESLQSSPREEKLYRALNRTYLKPAPTQEKAAELLDLPFSTYRRHLKAGIARVAEILWQQEIGWLEK
jgi:hypothetical protein